MATIQGFRRHNLWSSSAIDHFKTNPYCFIGILPWTGFEEIIKALTLFNETPLAYNDTLWGVRHLIDAWNHNMGTFFSPSYISCFDESTMSGANKYTFPGFMFVLCKP